MLVLKILGWLAVAAACAAVFVALSGVVMGIAETVDDHTGYRVITPGKGIVISAAGACIWAGYGLSWGWRKPWLHSADNGLALLIIGGLLLLSVIVLNFVRAGLLYGFIATLLQAAAFGFAAFVIWLTIYLMIVWAVLFVLYKISDRDGHYIIVVKD